MKRAWLAIALLSASWLFGTGLYHAPDWPVWGALVAAAALLLVGVADRRPTRGVAGMSLLMLAPGLVLLEWPHRAAVGLMMLGLVLQLAPIPRRWPARLGSAALLAGVALLAQGLALAAYESLTSRSHDLPEMLTKLLGGVAWLLGMDASASGSTVTLFSMRAVHPLAATWGLLVDPVSLGFIVGGIVLIVLRARARVPRSRRGWQTAVAIERLLITMIVWLPIRAGLLMAVYLHRVLLVDYDAPLDVVSQFWDPWVHLAAMGVPVLAAWALVRVPGRAAPASAGDEEIRATERATEEDVPMLLRPWRPWIAGGLALVAVAAITAGLLWHPVGVRKAGRVLVDDYHSGLPWPGKTFDTTRTDRPFDTEWYGHESAYNLSCLYDYCSRFYEMSRLTKPVTEEALGACDVLVLKVPSGPYGPAEVGAILGFVEKGGGLLLIGEHTSVYGSGVYLNDVARAFGFEFRPDCLFGIDSVFEEHWTPPPVPHPIVQRTGPIDFAISCSIAPGASPGTAVIRGTGLKNLPADYHAVNAYPQAVDRPDMRYGAFIQLWATRHGAGRVVAFTDSTILACFAAFEPGKSEMMLGMLEWLNHCNRMPEVTEWLVGLGAAMLAVGVALARRWHGGYIVLTAAGVLGFTVASLGSHVVNRRSMPSPQPVRPMVRVGIDRAVSAAPLPKSGFIAGKEGEFGQFERSILRLGYFTFRSAGADLFGANAAVILYPSREVDPALRDRLVAYVESGGKVLVLDGPENRQSTAAGLLRPFGLAFNRSAIVAGTVASPEGWPAVPVASAWAVEGGQPLASVDGKPVAAVVRRGSGAVVALGFGSRFTDARMGVMGDVVPDEALRKVFDFEYALLRALIENKLPAAPAAPAAPEN